MKICCEKRRLGRTSRKASRQVATGTTGTLAAEASRHAAIDSMAAWEAAHAGCSAFHAGKPPRRTCSEERRKMPNAPEIKRKGNREKMKKNLRLRKREQHIEPHERRRH